MMVLAPRVVIAGVAMLLAAGIAIAMKPTHRLAEMHAKVDLDTLIPESFGDWRIDPSIAPIQVSPDVQAKLDTLYDQTLARTYVNSRGQRVMLSVAYGANQSRALQLHKPEVCYAAQGFRVHSLVKSELKLHGAPVPVMHLVGEQGARVEPITYWMRIGDSVARGWLEQNRVRLDYGIRGTIPDGLLFRVSSISRDLPASYALQADFTAQLLEAAAPEQRHVLVGSGG